MPYEDNDDPNIRDASVGKTPYGYTDVGRAVIQPSKRLLDGLSSEQRKEYPVTTGFLDYFPDACAMVSHVSYLGNQKHNPGQPLHWSRGKSSDHADCIGRHLTTRNDMDGKVLHMAEMAWRSFAELQITLEKQYGLSPPLGAKEP